jgi:hypothetical protein
MCDSPLASPYLSLGANTLLPGATYVFFVAPIQQPDLAVAQVEPVFSAFAMLFPSLNCMRCVLVQIVVRTNSAPRAGNVTASPYKGSSFSTVFTFKVVIPLK